METILINDKKFDFIKDFKDNLQVRKSFNLLTRKTFGFDLEKWYQAGYWGSGHMPYSLLDGDNIVANVSASIINCLVLGENKTYVQIGTVMADPAYRNQGLVRYLMEKVIGEWKEQCDMIYLFANDSVLNFYPKFGFIAAHQYQCSKSVTNANEIEAAEKLDMSLDSNRALLVEKVNNSISMSNLKIVENAGLVMFYCTSFMSDNVYYLRGLDIIVIAEYKGDTLHLQDIFSRSEYDLDNIIWELANKEVKTVVLGFTPTDISSYCVNLLQEDNTTLFVMKDKQSLFQNNRLMFPVLSHT